MTDALYCPLQQEALLHINGPDSLTFLQGQTTCDTREVTPERAAPGVYCTPQGRVVCDFLLSQLGAEHFALRMRGTIQEHAAAVFGKYIVFSKADLDANRDDWQVAGVWGPDAAGVIADTFGSAPNGHWQAISGEDFSVVQLDTDGERFEVYFTGDASGERLSASCGAGTETEWQALDVRAGIARIDTGLVEEFVPQTLNYDLTGHISFTKGCYTGQEVVARLHYRGKPKRRSFVATLPADCAAGNGDELFANTASGSVGQLVNPVSTESPVALAAATLDGADSGLHVGSPDGPALRVSEPPYELDGGEEA